jgi:hypothetical protein
LKGVRGGVERRRGVCVGIETSEGPWAERNDRREVKSYGDQCENRTRLRRAASTRRTSASASERSSRCSRITRASTSTTTRAEDAVAAFSSSSSSSAPSNAATKTHAADAFLGPFHRSKRCRGGVHRRQMELKGVEVRQD